MTGCIEVTTMNGNKKLINVDGIYSIKPADSKEFKTWIENLCGEAEGVMESYDEIKESIREVLSPTIEVGSVKCTGNAVSIGAVKGGLTIDHTSKRTTMYQNASTVMNIKSIERFDA